MTTRHQLGLGWKTILRSRSPCSISSDLVARPNDLVVPLDVHPAGDVGRLLLDGHHQVQGLVVEALGVVGGGQ